MPRRERVVPTAPGEGVVAIQTPIAAMLEAGIGIEAYLRLARGGQLDLPGRSIKFNSTAAQVDKYRERGQVLPDGLPEMHGDINWHRDARRWGLHANLAMLGPTVFFWSAVRRGVAQIRFDGVLLAQTLVDNLPGRALRDVVEHPFLTDPGIVIVSATSGGPYPARNGIGGDRPAMTQFQITVPVMEAPDPVTETQGLQEREDA